MPPNKMMPWMALVPDINGVCSIEGTLEMTSMPTKMDRMKMNRRLVSIKLFGDEFLVHNFSAVRHEAALDDFVVQLEVENLFLLVPKFFEQVHEVRRIDL